MPYQRKTRDEYQIHSNYGYGWEEVHCEKKLIKALISLREYRENQPQYAHKMVKKRVKINEQ